MTQLNFPFINGPPWQPAEVCEIIPNIILYKIGINLLQASKDIF